MQNVKREMRYQRENVTSRLESGPGAYTRRTAQSEEARPCGGTRSLAAAPPGRVIIV